MESIISLGSPASAKAGRNRTVGQTANYGPPCSGIEWNGISWNIVEYRGIACNSITSGPSWSAIECNGISWNIVEYRGIAWNSITSGAVLECHSM